MRYKKTTKEKENGVVYTPIEMADYVATQMIQYSRYMRAGIKKKRKKDAALLLKNLSSRGWRMAGSFKKKEKLIFKRNITLM